jgi:antitoxin component HigA of HigAB toxin-antitoxin module
MESGIERAEHERMLAAVERLMDKSQRRTPEEDAALELMVRLIQDYEDQRHALRDPSPVEMLVYLMEQRATDLRCRFAAAKNRCHHPRASTAV